MPDPRYGYQPPQFFNYKLELDPQFANLASAYPVAPGWHVQPSDTMSLVPLPSPSVYQALDDAMQQYLASLSKMAVQMPTQPATALVPKAMAGAGDDTNFMDELRDAVGDAAQDQFWDKVPGRGRNFLTGEKTSIGSISPGSIGSDLQLQVPGTPVYDSVDQIIPGTRLKSSWLIPPFALTKRYSFLGSTDISFKLYVNKDAITANRPAALLSGAAAVIQGKTSDGLTRTLSIFAGSDQTGRPAGGFTLGFTFR